MTLTKDNLERYHRQIILPEIGQSGQEKLKSSSVLIVGVGGLGSPVAMYLAAAGVGRIGLVDADIVGVSNLHRQILFGVEEIGLPKVLSGEKRLNGLNPDVRVETLDRRLDEGNAARVIAGFDVVADCTDNFPTRYVISDACVKLGKPDVCASVFKFEGSLSVFAMKRGPCYRCLYPNTPGDGLIPDCGEGGVLGFLPGVMGTLQGTEIIKLLLGIGEPLVGRQLLFEALKMKLTEVAAKKNPACSVCSGESESEIAELKMVPESPDQITVHELKRRIDHNDAPFLLDVREQGEFKIANIGGQLIPLGQLSSRMGVLNRAEKIVVYCHHGIRSKAAVEMLRQSGFPHVRSLVGGIDAWSREIDPEVKRY